MDENYDISQLRQLEAESIQIFRDAAAQFERPVLLYSIGKDSGVLVRLAQKAFYYKGSRMHDRRPAPGCPRSAAR